MLLRRVSFQHHVPRFNLTQELSDKLKVIKPWTRLLRRSARHPGVFRSRMPEVLMEVPSGLVVPRVSSPGELPALGRAHAKISVAGLTVSPEQMKSRSSSIRERIARRLGRIGQRLGISASRCFRTVGCTVHRSRGGRHHQDGQQSRERNAATNPRNTMKHKHISTLNVDALWIAVRQ